VRKSFILTTQDLDGLDLSADDLVTDHLTDLNKADNARLEELGLDPQSVDRLIESLPLPQPAGTHFRYGAGPRAVHCDKR
jgi:hypothetical protein